MSTEMEEPLLPACRSLSEPELLRGSSSPPRARKQYEAPAVSVLDVYLKALLKLDLLGISLVYFVEGMLSTASLAVNYFLKDDLGLSPAMAGIALVAGQIPWEVTTVLGLLTDRFPLMGCQYRTYMFMIGVTGAAGWLLMPAVSHVIPATLLIFLTSLCTAWSQVIADAVTVKLSQGQDMRVASFYQGTSWATYTSGAILGAYVTGVMLEHQGSTAVFVLSAAGLMLDGLCAFMLSEQPQEGRMAKCCPYPGDAKAEAQPSMAQLVSRVWATIRSPYIFIPALFIFLWQSSPNPTSTMFYFQTEVLGFSPEFMEVVYLIGSMAGLGGIVFYNLFLVNQSMRSMMAVCAILGTLLSFLQLLLVSRVNVRMGISDKLLVVGNYSVLSALAELMMTPMLAVSCRACPEGIEATLLATIYSILNMSQAISAGLGSLLTGMFGVTDNNYGNMFLLMLVCNLCLLLPLPLLLWVPTTTEMPKEVLDTDGEYGEGQPSLLQAPVIRLEQHEVHGDGDVEAGAADAACVICQSFVDGHLGR